MLIRHSDRSLIQSIDQQQYNADELVQVKIPMSLPYLNNEVHYQRVDGEVRYNGVYYSYVQRKISNDTLYLLCLPNTTKTQLQGAKIDYAGKTADVPSNEQHPTGKKSGGFSEHQLRFNEFNFEIVPTLMARKHFTHDSPLFNSYAVTNLQPPEPEII